MLEAAEAEPVVELDARDAFLDGLPRLVAALGQSLAPVEVSNRKPVDNGQVAGEGDTDANGDVPPRKSKLQVAKEAKAKADALDSALDELLAVTSDMPEEDLPLTQAEIVSDVVFAGALEHLVRCLGIKQKADVRQRAAGARMSLFQAQQMS
jgi:hypothetical protein